jgi:peptidase C13-like protein
MRSPTSSLPPLCVAVLALGIMAALARPASAQDTHLLVITGVGGDEEHTAQFHQWATTIIDAAKDRGGLTEAAITYLGEKPDLAPGRINGRSTRENVQKAFAELAGRAKPEDEVFIVLIGHGSFDGRQAAFNLPGPDLTADDYAGLLAKLPAQRIVFVNTASSSGGFLAPLAGPGRVIVTATRTGGERNETRFAQYFADAFKDNAADTDRNGRVSVAEAFEYAKTKVAGVYQKGGYILTEHAAIDDGRDGKVAATLFLESERARAAATARVADPELRALLDAQRVLENQVAALNLRKESMDPAEYERESERLLTELALKTRAIRERGNQK